MNKLRLIASAALLLSSGLAFAQASNAPDISRAQKQADNVFRWIRLQADRPAAAPAAAPVAQAAAKPKAAAPAPVRVASAGTAAPAVALSSVAAAASPEAALMAANPPAAGYAAADTQPAASYTSSAPASAGATQYAPAQAQAAVEVPASSPVQEAAEPALNLIKRVDPELPANLELTERGFAQISFTVEPDGRVSNANVLKASMKRLGYAAAEAVRQWRFDPVKTAQHVAVQIEFAPE